MDKAGQFLSAKLNCIIEEAKRALEDVEQQPDLDVKEEPIETFNLDRQLANNSSVENSNIFSDLNIYSKYLH